jgi:DNA-directed RNA polymerase specialized sigma24 family protein
MTTATARAGLSPSQVEDILSDREVTAAVEKAARRLSQGRWGFVQSDFKDICQELLTEIYLGLLGCLPGEANTLGYVHQIIKAKIGKLVRHQKAAKRDYRRRGPSLDSEIVSEDGESTTLGEALAQGDDRRHDYGLSDQETAELRIDVDEVLREAPVQVRDIREGIGDGKSRSEIAFERGITMGTLRSRLAKLREPLWAVYRDYVQDTKDGYDASGGVTHDEREEALAISPTHTRLHEPS